MTNKEKEFFDLGFEYAEGIELANKVVVPGTGREVRRVGDMWEAQPFHDNYWKKFDTLLEALRFASRPE